MNASLTSRLTSRRTSHLASRRSVLAAAGTVGLATALVACGGSGEEDGQEAGDAAPEGDAGEDAEDGSGAGEGQELGKAADIPEGGGKVFKEQKVVVTQPSAGQYKAYSATCTHKGCLVTEVANGTIKCPCHGSSFSISDGSVSGGPATRPLPSAKVSVEGGTVRLDD
ncbi:Rieske (2Fe-2S) protein [Streptomyces daliensis]|uniref:Cytochrome bc1 complex Rieske iron-sulfur subunit n=1 Tax=Streptomyces daliensis TaxID=299421 RepID=A0A8T4IL35_9ACTN|nr:Rieske (2Fe-2S) protein [Streptomyces daliensis]